jgi:hypothetical protein
MSPTALPAKLFFLFSFWHLLFLGFWSLHPSGRPTCGPNSSCQKETHSWAWWTISVIPTLREESGRVLGIWGQSGLHSKTLSQKKKN